MKNFKFFFSFSQKQYRETLGKKKNLGFQILAFSTDYGESIVKRRNKSNFTQADDTSTHVSLVSLSRQ